MFFFPKAEGQRTWVILTLTDVLVWKWHVSFTHHSLARLSNLSEGQEDINWHVADACKIIFELS